MTEISELREGRHMYSVMAKQFRNLENINELVNRYLIELKYIQESYKNCDLSNPQFLESMINIMEFQDDFQRIFILNILRNMEPMLNHYAPIATIANKMNGIEISDEVYGNIDLKNKVMNMREITHKELNEIVNIRDENEKSEVV